MGRLPRNIRTPARSSPRRPWRSALSALFDGERLADGRHVVQALERGPRDDAFAREHPWLAARLSALTGEPSGLLALARALDAEPYGDYFGGHFGGRHEESVAGDAPTSPRCPICQVPLAHIAAVAEVSLSACREHPTCTELLVFETIADEDIDALFS